MQKKENIVLLPKTVDYYQFQLTRMLETDRYAEAAELLDFLQKCQCDDPRLYGEWQALADWLATMSPQTGRGIDKDESVESEADMAKQLLQMKTSVNSRYVDDLLGMLNLEKAPDKQILALEQLALIEHPGINPGLVRWLQQSEKHPNLQFKALQILKKRGMTGAITVRKFGRAVRLQIEDTPLSVSEFPDKIGQLLNKIRQVSEVNTPALYYFAEQTWNEFLAFIYGSEAYQWLLEENSETQHVWSAALHMILLELMFDAADECEIRELYGISDNMSDAWNRAEQFVRLFARTSFLPNLK